MTMAESDPLLPEYQPWEHADTRRYLDANPLPIDFLWPDQDGTSRPVRPRHKSVIGYGKWLHETPYFPHLFELIHTIIVHASELGDAAWLAAELDLRRPPSQPEVTL